MNENIDINEQNDINNGKKDNKKLIVLSITFLIIIIAIIILYIFFNSDSKNNMNNDINNATISDDNSTISDDDNINIPSDEEDNNLINDDEINQMFDYDYNLNVTKKTHEFGDYIITYYEDIAGYYLLNKNNKSVNLLVRDNNKDREVFALYNLDAEIFGIVVPKYNIVNTDYSTYNCSYISGVELNTCKHSETTFVYDYTDVDTRIGIISLKTGKLVLDEFYDDINEIETGNFLVGKDGKHGLVSNSGKFLFDVKYDFIGYISGLGYIVFEDNTYKIYNDNLNLIDNIDLYESYNSILDNLNKGQDEKVYNLGVSTATSSIYLLESYLIKNDINQKYSDDYSGISFKYSANNFKGEQLILFDKSKFCDNKKDFFYILDNGNLYKIKLSDLIIKDEEIRCWY